MCAQTNRAKTRTVLVSNGHKGKNNVTQAVQVVSIKGRQSRSTNTHRLTSREKEPVHVAGRPTYSGSRDQCVAISFSRNLDQKQQDFVEQAVRKHECAEYIHQIRWRSNKTIVIEVRINTLCECSRIDVETAIGNLAAKIPVKS